MMSNPNHIDPQDADQAKAPAVNAAQVNVTSTGDVQVIVQERSTGGMWFQVLEELILSGIWGTIQDRHRNVIMVMHMLRDRQSGDAYAPFNDWTDSDGRTRPGLLALTRLPRATIYDALREMCVTPAAVPLDAPAFASAAAGLLARRGRDLFQVMPGYLFAGRRPPAEAAQGVRHTGLSPVHRTGDPHPVRCTVKDSGAPDSSPLLHRETQARSKKRIENSSSTTNLPSADREEAIRLLVSGLGDRFRGFGRRDAERILDRTGALLEDVRIAVANAAHVARTKAGLRSWTGYVRTQLEDGCSLFPAIQRQQDNARRVTDRLHRLARELGDEATCGALTEWWGRQSPSRIAGLMSEPAWHSEDEAFWSAVTRKVSIEISG